MARQTDEKKWSDSWFRSLCPEFKLAWLYLLDNVDRAGVLDLDRELAEFQIRCHVDWERFLVECGNRVRKLSNGRLWVPKFVKFQAGDLQGPSGFVRGVRDALQKHGLLAAYLDEFPPTCGKSGGRLQGGLAKAPQRLTEPLEGEGEGEGEGYSEIPEVSQKITPAVAGPPKAGSAAPPSPPAAGAGDGFQLGVQPAPRSRRASRFSLPLRSGAACPVSQSVIDKAQQVYGWSDAEIAKIVGKAELWCLTNRRSAPAKSADQFLTNWFAREDTRSRPSSPGPSAAAAGAPATTKFGNPVGWKAQLD